MFEWDVAFGEEFLELAEMDVLISNSIHVRNWEKKKGIQSYFSYKSSSFG